jgi:hypothetical protein
MSFHSEDRAVKNRYLSGLGDWVIINDYERSEAFQLSTRMNVIIALSSIHELPLLLHTILCSQPASLGSQKRNSSPSSIHVHERHRVQSALQGRDSLKAAFSLLVWDGSCS